jgi:GNAT superfamily N-acetyltransferase
MAGFEALRVDARAEGCNFVEKLAEQWESGENRFDAPGEIFLAHVDRGRIVAVGGLNRDPYAGDPSMGRIRRVYVRPAWRKRGIGEALVAALIAEARESFTSVRLRAMNPEAARLYEKLKFVRIDDPNATHMLRFNKS